MEGSEPLQYEGGGGSGGTERMKMKGVGVGLVNQGGEELERVRSG